MQENNIPDRLKEDIISYFSGDLNKQQADELIKWLAKNTDNVRYFNKIMEIWQATAIVDEREIDSEKALLIIRNKIRTRNIRPIPSLKIPIHIFWFLKIAAAIILVTLLGTATFIVFKRHNPIVLTDTYFEAHVPKGSKTLITLSEGTQVWLNAGTTLRYKSNFGSSNRDVYLEGEAFFTVKKNKQLPFKVTTSDICITALGTAFNVKSYKEENIIETTLEEGSLRIDPIKSTNYSKKINPIYLKQNQNLIFQKESENTIVVHQKKQTKAKEIDVIEKNKILPAKVTTVTDIRLFTSWKDKHWVFKNEKLSTLAPKLERRYDVNIIFEDSALLNYAFSGTLKDESIEQVLAAIQFTAPIRFDVNYKEVRLHIDNQLKEKYYYFLKP